MRSTSKMVAGVVAAALLASSTATAATAQSTAPAAQAQSPWVTLSMLTPVGATALGESAVVAAQPENPPPPPPDAGPGWPPIPVIAIWLLTLGVFIYIVTKGNNHHHIGNSPV